MEINISIVDKYGALKSGAVCCQIKDKASWIFLISPKLDEDDSGTDTSSTSYFVYKNESIFKSHDFSQIIFQMLEK